MAFKSFKRCPAHPHPEGKSIFELWSNGTLHPSDHEVGESTAPALAHVTEVTLSWSILLSPQFGSISPELSVYITCDPAVLRIYSADGLPAPGQVYARKHVKILIAALPIILKGREVGGGFRMGNTCTPVADSCQRMAKPIQCCKVKKQQQKNPS